MKNIIAGYRRMTGLTQAEVAGKFGISRQAYFNKESGITPFSDREKVIFTNLVNEIIPEVSIIDIFFKVVVGK